MGLFKRKRPTDLATRCPGCGEQMPDGAHKCAMCGHDFGDGADDQSHGVIPLESSSTSRPNRS
jgi:hypothetical protein